MMFLNKWFLLGLLKNGFSYKFDIEKQFSTRIGKTECIKSIRGKVENAEVFIEVS